jgi:hypothetical protein
VTSGRGACRSEHKAVEVEPAIISPALIVLT